MLEIAMPDLDDATLATIELEQRRKAEGLLKEFWGFAENPMVDAAGLTRVGYGWPIHEQSMSLAAAEAQVSEQVGRIQDVLRFRIYEILGLHPDAKDRVAYLYLVGDIIKPEELRDMDELWRYVRAGEWDEVAIELQSLNWDKRIQMTRENKRRLLFITNRIQHGEPE